MGMALGAEGAHGKNSAFSESSDINVTPFVDVMLVLLIIFMVVAPLPTVDVNVDLPASTAKPAPRPDKPIFLTVKADHSLTLGDDPVTKDALGAAIDKLSNGDKTQRVFLRADKTVDYETLMQVMNDLRAAGYRKIALVGLDQSQAQ